MLSDQNQEDKHLLPTGSGTKKHGSKGSTQEKMFRQGQGKVGLVLMCTSVVAEEGNVGGSIPLSPPSQGES